MAIDGRAAFDNGINVRNRNQDLLAAITPGTATES